MPMQINLDVVLAKRKMKSEELVKLVGITPKNLSIVKTGKAKAFVSQHLRPSAVTLSANQETS